MWVRYTKSDGIWEINVSNLEFFMRSCAHSDAVIKNATTSTQFVTFGPDITTVDIDWPSVRKDRDQSAAATLQEFYDRLDATQGGNVLRELLVTMKTRAEADDAAYLEKVRNAQKQTNGAIESSVAAGKVAESVAVLVRDASATALLTGATVMTGGAILPFVGVVAAGTGLKFVAKYQDTGDVAAATFTASAEMLMTVIGVGAALRGTSQVVRTIIALVGSTGFAGIGAVLEGKEVAPKISGKAAGGAADRIAFRSFVAPVFSRSPQGVLISGLISTGTKMITESIVERDKGGTIISNAKNAPFIDVPEAMIALTPQEHFIESSIMRKVEAHPHSPVIPFL